MIEFSDGMNFDTSGPLRVVRKSDGYYVVGRNMLVPVNDREEGLEIIREDAETMRRAEERFVWKEGDIEILTPGDPNADE